MKNQLGRNIADGGNPLGVTLGIVYATISFAWLVATLGFDNLHYFAGLSGLVFAFTISTARRAYVSGWVGSSNCEPPDRVI